MRSETIGSCLFGRAYDWFAVARLRYLFPDTRTAEPVGSFDIHARRVFAHTATSAGVLLQFREKLLSDELFHSYCFRVDRTGCRPEPLQFSQVVCNTLPPSTQPQPSHSTHQTHFLPKPISHFGILRCLLTCTAPCFLHASAIQTEPRSHSPESNPSRRWQISMCKCFVFASKPQP
jgi:hypothetical protein